MIFRARSPFLYGRRIQKFYKSKGRNYWKMSDTDLYREERDKALADSDKKRVEKECKELNKKTLHLVKNAVEELSKLTDNKFVMKESSLDKPWSGVRVYRKTGLFSKSAVFNVVWHLPVEKYERYLYASKTFDTSNWNEKLRELTEIEKKANFPRIDFTVLKTFGYQEEQLWESVNRQIRPHLSHIWGEKLSYFPHELVQYLKKN